MQDYVGKSVVGTVPFPHPQGQFIVACALYEAITMCKKVHCDSDSMKACLEMLFVDISRETAVPGDDPFQLWLE